MRDVLTYIAARTVQPRARGFKYFLIAVTNDVESGPIKRMRVFIRAKERD